MIHTVILNLEKIGFHVFMKAKSGFAGTYDPRKASVVPKWDNLFPAEQISALMSSYSEQVATPLSYFLGPQSPAQRHSGIWSLFP